jgi:hypothetical protein
MSPGVLRLLDDECVVGGGVTSASALGDGFATKLYQV